MPSSPGSSSTRRSSVFSLAVHAVAHRRAHGHCHGQFYGQFSRTIFLTRRMGKATVLVSQISCLTSTGPPRAGLELASITLSSWREKHGFLALWWMVDGDVRCASSALLSYTFLWLREMCHDSHITFPSGFKTPPLSAVHAMQQRESGGQDCMLETLPAASHSSALGCCGCWSALVGGWG